ncbi:MAG TPA: amylo-alpha-1,6-glucosidase [Desulfobacteraceae bacterium]|nr:amylo-alpha-1,6-glucosidase [Desulfobacteraceae bacterium]
MEVRERAIMHRIKTPRQYPEPGAHLIAYKGDTLEFTLELPRKQKGGAWVRSNIGKNAMRYREIIDFVDHGKPIMSRDWYDIPMRQIDDRRFSILLPINEVGRFEAKAFFMPEGSNEPVWPEGDNVVIKAEPAEYCCSNTIYTAFVRQFGPNKYGWSTTPQQDASVKELEKNGFSVIPRSGTFRDLIKELDFIIGRLRFRIVQLLPIHPAPTTYARMGRFGSPFAALDFKDVDPSLSEFDRRTTPKEQFVELLDAVHEREGRLFIDIPINHTGWASHLQVEHPKWFARGSDRTFESPCAWGVTWEDLAKLDYSHKELWKYIAEVFLFWCRVGVDGVRCDAGYMIPYAVWEYVVAKVRSEFPDTIFLLEGLGGKIETMEELLAGANLDWAYSELFQNYDRGQIENYLPDCIDISSKKGILVHFAETHDNNRLASVSRRYAMMRTALTALFSHNGAFGITNGVEWFAKDKINVHDARPLNWGSEENQIDFISRINAILGVHQCFHDKCDLRLVETGKSNTVVLVRRSLIFEKSLLVVANLDDDKPNTANWNLSDFGSASTLFDLLSGSSVDVRINSGIVSYRLEPGQVACLTCDISDLDRLEDELKKQNSFTEGATQQILRAKVLELHAFFNKKEDIIGIDIDGQTIELTKDPRVFCADVSGMIPSPAVTWKWPEDSRRIVMVPYGGLLYVKSAFRFVAELRLAGRILTRQTGMKQNDGWYFSLMAPDVTEDLPARCELALTVFENDGCRHSEAPVIFLAKVENALVVRGFKSYDALKKNCYAICTNGRGAMSQVRAAWGEVESQYDAILAGNLNPGYPVDRTVMLTRCRAWLICQGYSHPVDRTCLDYFSVNSEGSVLWRFNVPAGQGRMMSLEIRLSMVQEKNTVQIDFYRRTGTDEEGKLDVSIPVKLIIRPDIEDRINHHKTKAYTGPENSWPDSLFADGRGFIFKPSEDHYLKVTASCGQFTREPEWKYLVNHPLEAERGLDDCSDLFSPGYFSAHIDPGKSVILHASIESNGGDSSVNRGDNSGDCLEESQEGKKAKNALYESDGKDQEDLLTLDRAMMHAIKDFIVKRDGLHTVIAGYPWFLDWGRDTLICLRGMIEAGMLNLAREILIQFARFESQGTLPNMISGNDASNRDTSDAPLWFFVACNDIFNKEEGEGFLDTDCGGRKIRDVLHSIADGYLKGTPNGIRMDTETGLIFSPAHYTWMDTNYPAGTPREGYPVEIQALWHAALRMMARLEPGGLWEDLAVKVSASINDLYLRKDGEFLSDCLHARPGQSAVNASADDALRPNQLLAITLGALNDKKVCSAILTSCEELLVPGAIRSLADRRVSHHLPVEYKGDLLNDPAYPYWGFYTGDEDRRRKPAYHNGTAWTWLFPSYAEALFTAYGENARDMALSVLSSATEIINQGCLGQVPEILDGDAPHGLCGCGAQAWGVTELYRVFAILKNK